MDVITICGENRFPNTDHVREACRGIVFSDGKLLMTYEEKTDQWFIPGGGREGAESYEECCIREIAEETGVLVNPRERLLTVNEYYEDWLYISHYYICDAVGTCERNLTAREMEVGLVPRLITSEEALEIFSHHNDYAGEQEMTRGCYLREYHALLRLMEWQREQ